MEVTLLMDISANIIAFVIGVLSSLLGGMIVGLWLIYRQFTKSIAGYRLDKVVEATREIINEVKSTNAFISPFRDKYRFSLGVTIHRLIKSFGTKEIRRKAGIYPNLQTKDPEDDRWTFFKNHIRPVIVDVTIYSFIGFIGWIPSWIPFFPKKKRLRALVELCNHLETVAAELDAMRELEKHKKLKILAHPPTSRKGQEEKELIRIEEQHDSSIEFHIQKLKREYDLLEDYWKAWLELVDK